MWRPAFEVNALCIVNPERPTMLNTSMIKEKKKQEKKKTYGLYSSPGILSCLRHKMTCNSVYWKPCLFTARVLG